MPETLATSSELNDLPLRITNLTAQTERQKAALDAWREAALNQLAAIDAALVASRTGKSMTTTRRGYWAGGIWRRLFVVIGATVMVLWFMLALSILLFARVQEDYSDLAASHCATPGAVERACGIFRPSGWPRHGDPGATDRGSGPSRRDQAGLRATLLGAAGPGLDRSPARQCAGRTPDRRDPGDVEGELLTLLALSRTAVRFPMRWPTGSSGCVG
ncbi:MAG: hypothetical protein HPM95_06705 [Alphaproteobacteria bacterium]|nr:hypothetical protein [Alphaproteobacteria bacterium]